MVGFEFAILLVSYTQKKIRKQTYDVELYIYKREKEEMFDIC